MKYKKLSDKDIDEIRKKTSINEDIYYLEAIKRMEKDLNISSFENLDDLIDEYFSKIRTIVSKYDSILLYVEYRDFIVNKYNDYYFYEHKELELITVFTHTYSQRKSYKTLKKLFKNRIKSEELEELDWLLKKIMAYYLTVNSQKLRVNNSSQVFQIPELVMRFKTAHIRNEGSGSQYLDYLCEIAVILDTKQFRHTGISLDKYLKLFNSLVNFKSNLKKEIYKKVSQKRFLKSALNSMFGIKHINFFDWSLIYHDNNRSFITSIYDTFYDLFYDVNYIKLFLNEKEFNNLYKIFLTNNNELNKSLPLKNPLWDNPLILMNNGYVFNPVPTLPLTYMEDILLNLLDENNKKVYYQIKTERYLEDKVYRLLSQKYKKISLYQNVEYKVNNKMYESDLLLIYQNFAVIIEIKGQKISKNGKIGKSETVERHVLEIIGKASQQANQLKQIISKKGINILSCTNNQKMEVDFSNIEEIITVSISFEWLIFISTTMIEIRNRYNILPGHIHCSLAELDDVVDILETEEQFLLYLMKRKYLEESNLLIKSDELDLITHYVKNGFAFKKNSFGFIDLVGEFNSSSNFGYFQTKFSLNDPSDFYIVRKVFSDNKKLVFRYNAIVTSILDYLNCKNIYDIKLKGYFESIPFEKQDYLLEKALLISNTSTKSTMVKPYVYELDDYSPKLLLVNRGESDIESAINRIRLYINTKKYYRYGYIILVFSVQNSIPSIEHVSSITR